MRSTSIYLLIILRLFFSPAEAQKAGYDHFININPGTGASSISCILQDHQGLIWIGSNKGLYSYDGYHFQAHYSFDQPSNTRIHCGVEVDGKYLYLGADNGLLVYNLHSDEYENYPANFPHDVRCMYLQDHHLWLGTLNGLFRYDIQTKQLKHYSSLRYPNLAHQSIYTIVAAGNDDLYIGTYNGLSLYSAENDEFQPISLPFASQKSNQFINSLLIDSLGECLWIGLEGGLLRYKLGDKSFETIDNLTHQSVKSLAFDGHHNLLIGTDNGLFVYDQNSSVRHILHDSRSDGSLSNNIIWTLFVDRNQNIWFGTDFGISLSHYNQTLRYVTISDFTNTGEGNQFYSIVNDSHGYYWFGGTHGLIRASKTEYGLGKTLWYNMGDPKYPLSHSRIRDIYEDREGNLWIATDGSIHLFNYQTQQFKSLSITDTSGQYNANWAYDIFEDDHGQLWIATCLGGIFVVNKQRLMENKSSCYVADFNFNCENGLAGMFVNQIVPDKLGNVWVLLYNQGINKINIQSHMVEKYSLSATDKIVSPSYLLCDDQGMIWLGFRGGVMRIDPSTNDTKVIHFDDFSSNEVLAMAVANGKIWISTTDGLWLVDQHLLESQRLQLSERRFFSLFFDGATNDLYLGDVNGYAVIKPHEVDAHLKEKPIISTALSVNGMPMILEGSSIRYANHIGLTHRQNTFAIDITDLPFDAMEQSRFVYRLYPIEDRWTLLESKDNRITYTNLNPGDYQLIVGKLDSSGNPSAHQYKLDLEICPPWYYTVGAKIIYILLLLSFAVWVINFFRVKHRLKIERIEKEKILEQSQMKMDFLSNLSHALKTPLSMIIAPVSKLIPEVKNAHEKQQLKLVQQNAMKMNAVIHKIFDFNRIDSSSSSLLIRSHIELVSFAGHIFSGFKENDANKRLAFSFTSNVEDLYIELDAVKIESVIDNVLSNAVKYTPDGGRVSMTIAADLAARKLSIIISDSGIGIPPNEIAYIFQRFYQSSLTAGRKEGTGIGLYLVKSYVELHGGQVTVASTEGNGTTISISLPLLESGPIIDKPEDHKDVMSHSVNGALILVVDDTPEITSFICNLLHPQYRCLVADNGKVGLELCLANNPDLIISDVVMPEMDGLQMCRQIRKNLPTSTIPIILLTAKNDKATELESIRMNIDAFVAKPFEPAILLSRVEQLLSKDQKIEQRIRMAVLTEPKEIEARSYDEKFLFSITQIIEDNLSDNELNVASLCNISGINSKQLYRKIKLLTGKTPVEYIKVVRMKKAAMLLQQQKFTVAEVMYMVGFSNHSYFAKCFKEEFDKTPAQFKDQIS